MFRSLIQTTATWATLPLRLVLGAVFIAHGAQKVLGVWGGPGFAKFIGMPAPLDWMAPGWFWMGAAAFSELVGGVFVLIGFLTRLGALALAVVMLVAVFAVHWGSFFMPTGIEYALSLLGVSIALLIAGGGRVSVDGALAGSRGRR